MTTMDIRAALSQIYKIQEGMSIDSPRVVKVEKVYHYWPDSSEVVSDDPCWINSWTMPTLEFQSALLTGEFTIHMQLLCYDADSSEAADVASAFLPVIIQAFAENIKLGLSEWTVRRLRSYGASTLTTFPAVAETSGRAYVGLDLALDLFCIAGTTNLPGGEP